MPTASERWLMLGSTLLLLVALGADPVADRLTWALETAPVVIGVVVLAGTHRQFPFSALGYRLLWLLGVVMMVGGYYGYGDVPLFEWTREAFHLERNYYDRMAHLLLGITTAIVVRELLIRLSPLHRGGWLSFLTLATVAGLGACYEILEWWTALAAGEAAGAFLAVQGDAWDAQKDMFVALAGGALALVLLRNLHDSYLRAVDPTLRVRK